MDNLPNVAIVIGERGHKLVFEALDLIDYKKALTGFDKVVIKVNLIINKTFDNNATVDPLVVEAIILKLKEIPIKQIYVVESDSTVTGANAAFQVTGIKEMCSRHNVECINLSEVKKKVKLAVPNPEKLKSITIPRLITESAVISAATKITLGMENMFGLLMDKNKTKYYAKGLSAVAVDINTVIKPKLTVISGFFGRSIKDQGNEEFGKKDLIIAGEDVVATDAVASRVMGFDPTNIKHLIKANAKGLGSINSKILGQQIDVAAGELEKAKTKTLSSSWFTCTGR